MTAYKYSKYGDLIIITAAAQFNSESQLKEISGLHKRFARCISISIIASSIRSSFIFMIVRKVSKSAKISYLSCTITFLLNGVPPWIPKIRNTHEHYPISITLSPSPS